INFGTLKCKDKRCGKCCLDNDYDSEMEYNGEIIEDLTEIICKTMWMPNDIVDLIVEYIDNSPICGVCKYYCESVLHCCNNCNKCYSLIVIKCSKCKLYDDETQDGLIIDKCSICNRHFCNNCGNFELTFSGCYENCRHCKKDDCYNVRVISKKCISCSKNHAY